MPDIRTFKSDTFHVTLLSVQPRLDLIVETRVPRGVRPTLRAVMLELMRRHTVTGEVCVVLTNNIRMRALKKAHWNEDAITDVLSFPAWEPGDSFMPDTLGDIIISIAVADTQAKARAHKLEVEVCILAAHGLTHLMGLDHQTVIEWEPFHAIEREVLEILATRSHNGGSA